MTAKTVIAIARPGMRYAAANAPRDSDSLSHEDDPRSNSQSEIHMATGKKDAIDLLKADHREVEQLFKEFESNESESDKRELAARICQALTVHATVEEEIFYPAFIEATEEEDIHHEAVIEHVGAKRLIADIEESEEGDEFFDAKVSVLSEMIKHHVKEEEAATGMFGKARKSDMDLEEVGAQIAARKAELMADAA